MITDLQRLEFMQALHAATRAKNGLLLPEWESHFLASFLQSSRPALWFTPGRRAATDRIWMRYGPEIGRLHPLDTVSERPALAAADPNGCEYLVREDGRTRRCNEAAAFRDPGRLRYCQPHAEAASADCKRAGIKLCLVAFQPTAK